MASASANTRSTTTLGAAATGDDAGTRQVDAGFVPTQRYSTTTSLDGTAVAAEPALWPPASPPVRDLPGGRRRDGTRVNASPGTRPGIEGEE